MPPKRAAPKETQAETQAVNKRYRQAIDEVAEEYVCPITAELPIDPVTAEDGRCYERYAIEEWFVRQPQAQVKSPVTNEPMGKRLLPAVQLRNTLKRLVESGAISGSKADAWKTAMAEEAEVAALRVKAEGGDAVAMAGLGFAYRDGSRGLKKDMAQSFMWFKRAADLKEVHALSACGVAYLSGDGVERSTSRGYIMLGIAAGMGSECACGILGQANAEGLWGLDKDPQEATRWYREMQKCDRCRNSNEETRERAAAWLREHP
jgi:TPR repeat protein